MAMGLRFARLNDDIDHICGYKRCSCIEVVDFKSTNLVNRNCRPEHIKYSSTATRQIEQRSIVDLHFTCKVDLRMHKSMRLSVQSYHPMHQNSNAAQTLLFSFPSFFPQNHNHNRI
jgi:hypothetical protein